MSELLDLETAEPAHLQIRRYFQQRILSGELKPGERIPSTQDLARQWGLSCTAVQKALTALTAAGMLMRTRRRGTFVSQMNDQAVIGILIGPSLTDEASHYYRALLHALQEEIADKREHRHWNYLAYDGLTPAALIRPLSEVRPYQQFLKDAQNYPFKGLIEIAGGIHWSADLRQQTSLPIFDCSEVCFDIIAFQRASLALALKANRKRVAYIMATRAGAAPILGDVDALCSELGLPAPEILNISISGCSYQRAEAVHIQMLQHFRQWWAKPEQERPETIIVSDDIVMRSVALAIIETGIEVPRELLVISTANEGINLYLGIPVTRYQLSSRKQARLILNLLWNRIQGLADPSLPILLPGRFDSQ